MPLAPLQSGPAAPYLRPLTEGWELALLPPGAAADPVALAAIKPQWLPARVPGTAAAALFAAGEADFSRLPDLDAQDVWYRCVFRAEGHVAARHRLLFEGLATLAQVWLNGRPVLQSSSMFLAHEVEAGAGLGTDNELLIRFAALGEALKAAPSRPRWRAGLVEQQQLRRVRTTLLGRIPGWTPKLAAVGPWKPVGLQRQGALEWQGGELRAALEGGSGVVRASVELRSASPGIRVSAAQLQLGEAAAALQVRQADGQTWHLSGEVRLDAVQLWWPHTHGEPVLYPVRVQVESSSGALELDFGKTGFRLLHLHCRDGEFAFELNGAPLFCRGACWTPGDILNLLGDEAATRQQLLLAREAGMNLLRVSGPMCYEADHFHALCDELGILVWQDWMFAAMDYPAGDPAFVSAVEDEARQFLRRTQLSPSLALLCGNSEVEQQAAMLGLPRECWRNALFAEVLPRLGAALRPDVPYWPSSPAGGVLPFQVDRGAAHYFGVGAYLRPLSDARRCGLRFAAECLAFANVPEAETAEQILGAVPPPVHHPAWKARVPRDRGAGWDFDDVRDHYLRELFQADPLQLRYADPERYLALGRVVTGEVMAATFGEWRRHGSSCAGALVWFLRDLWPGAGWGVVDSTGLPKAAWYYLKRAMAPLALFITDEGLNGLALHAVNDRAQPLAARLSLSLYRQGGQRVAQAAQDIRVPPRGSLELRAAALLDGFLDVNYAYRFGPPGHELVHAQLLDAATGSELAGDFFFPLGHAFAVQPALGLEGELTALDDGSYRLAVGTAQFAQAVSIEAPGWRPEHNYFHLAPGARRELRLLPRQPGLRLRQVLVGALNTAQRLRLTPAPVQVRA
jgi:beta-mannosidase